MTHLVTNCTIGLLVFLLSAPYQPIYGQARNANKTDNPLRAKIGFTMGPAGPLWNSSFLPSEIIFGVISVSGLNDVKPYEGQLSTQITVTDSAGMYVAVLPIEFYSYFQLLGGDKLVIPFKLNAKEYNLPSEKLNVNVEVTHHKSKRSARATRAVAFNSPKGLVGMEFRLTRLDGESVPVEIPAGPVLSPGMPYSLRSRTIGAKSPNRTFRLNQELQFHDNSLKLSGRKFADTISISASRFGEVPTDLEWATKFAVNRSGDFFLRLVLNDMQSNHSCKYKLPCRAGRSPSHLFPTQLGNSLEAEIEFVRGAYGMKRDNLFYSGERAHMDVQIRGLDSDEEGHARISTSFRIIDADGNARSNPDRDVESIPMIAAGNTTHQHFWIKQDTPDLTDSTGKFQFELTIKDVLSGRRTVVTKPLLFKPVTSLTALNYRITWDPLGKYIAESVLCAGQTYYLCADIVGFESDLDQSIKLEHSLRASNSEQGDALGTELVLRHDRIRDVSVENADSLEIAMPFTPNRKGEFILRSSVADRVGNRTHISEIPVVVVEQLDEERQEERERF